MNVIFFLYLFTDLGEKVKKSQLSSTFHVLRAVDVEGNTEEPGRGMGSDILRDQSQCCCSLNILTEEGAVQTGSSE